MRRHSSRDKDMKGFVDHASVTRREPAPEEHRVSNHRRNHKGLFCVDSYFMVISVAAAIRDIRLRQGWPCFKTGIFYGIEGLDYETARELARELRRGRKA